MRKFRRLLFLKLARLMRGEKNVVPCIISVGTKVSGNILEADVIHIDGKIEGDICCRELIIGPTGNVLGNIRAKNLEIFGLLNGGVYVDNLFISSTAQYIGDATYKTISIEPGALLEGRCSKERNAASTVK